jgi:hypothetical protein
MRALFGEVVFVAPEETYTETDLDIGFRSPVHRVAGQGNFKLDTTQPEQLRQYVPKWRDMPEFEEFERYGVTPSWRRAPSRPAPSEDPDDDGTVKKRMSRTTVMLSQKRSRLAKMLSISTELSCNISMSPPLLE